jgi:hypothetical protein
VLLACRGVPVRFRAYFVIVTLLALIRGLGALRSELTK